MSGHSSADIAGRARVAILVIVVALCVVPALVRATFSGSTGTPIRLNRGFELPPGKASLAPPPTTAVAPISHQQNRPARLDRRAPAFDDVAPYAAPVRWPDPLRGPPTLPRA
jgi:hypothetical protein